MADVQPFWDVTINHPVIISPCESGGVYLHLGTSQSKYNNPERGLYCISLESSSGILQEYDGLPKTTYFNVKEVYHVNEPTLTITGYYGQVGRKTTMKLKRSIGRYRISPDEIRCVSNYDIVYYLNHEGKPVRGVVSCTIGEHVLLWEQCNRRSGNQLIQAKRFNVDVNFHINTQHHTQQVSRNQLLSVRSNCRDLNLPFRYE
jgi:hypothetical protein